MVEKINDSSEPSKKFWITLSYVIIVLLLFILLIGTVVLGWLLYYRSRVLPGLQLLQTSVGGYSRNQVVELIEQETQSHDLELNLEYEDRSWKINLKDVGYKIDTARTARDSVNWGKEWPSILQVLSLTGSSKELPLAYSVDHDLLAKQISLIKEEVETPAIEPEIQVSPELVVTSQQGTVGRKVMDEELNKQISFYMAWLVDGKIPLPVSVSDLRVSEERLKLSEDRARKWLGKNIVFTYNDETITWEGAKIASLVGMNQDFSEVKIKKSTDLLSERINRPAKDAVFEFDSIKGRVKEFKAEEKGVSLEKDIFVDNIENVLKTLEGQATDSAKMNLPVITVEPKIKANDVNDLGIKELIGMGDSHFKGSIPSRLHNIGLGMSRVNGVIIAPGEEFSFVKNIGEISSSTGYEPAYIIMNGQTILGDGGGVCQVSTTVFRAALNTGLPITQRHAHSYRVSYYEQQSFPGLDATVYPPNVDLKFVNDTPAHILMQTTFDEQNRYAKVEFYGTGDGRVAEISNPRLWDVIQPAEDLYIDDPNLPVGQVKQTEHRINGAKAAFDWKVMRDGQVIQEKTFTSVFRPWQGVYLRGTKTN